MANRFTIQTVFSAVDKMTGTIGAIGGKVSALGEKIDKSTKKMRDGVGKAAGGIKTMAVGIGSVSLAAGAAIYGLATKASSAADSIGDTAASLGISTKALQEYRYVAALSGMETADMDNALKKLTVNLGKGGGELDATLSMLGLTAEQLRAAGPDQSLELIADGMKNITDPAARAAVVTQLFGKSSVRMTNALAGGSEGLKRMREEAQATGYVMDDAAVAAGQNLGDAIDRLKATFEGLLNRAGGKFVPFLEKIAVGLQAAAAPGGFLSNMMDVLMTTLESIAPVIESLGTVLSEVFVGLGPVIKQLGKMFASIAKVIGPIFGKLFKALLPIIMKLVSFIEKLLPPILELVSVLADLLIPVLEMLEPILDIIFFILEPIIKLIAFLIKMLVGGLIPVAKALKAVFSGIVGFFSGIFNGIASVANAAWEGIKMGFAAMVGFLQKIFFTWADYVLTVIGTVVKTVLSAAAAVGKFLGADVSALESVVDKITKLQDDVRAKSAFSDVQKMMSGGGTPISPNTGVIQSSTTTTNTSKVDVNFANPPAGTSVKQTGVAPGFSFSLGPAGVR